MECYLDNSATTKCFEEVKNLVADVMTKDYGNPSSMHRKGVEAEKFMKQAKEIIAANLKVNEKEIFFTSGGTESNNLAIIGAAMANMRAGKHLITSAIEHPSVMNAMKYLEEQGFLVTYLPVDHNGIIDLEKLKEALCDETILVSIMYVNNEIGAASPVEETAQLIKKFNPNILYHVDAIQAFGKYRILPKRQGIDMLSISGHKINGPKGVGVLYVNEKVKIRPIIFGGGQQKGMRSGTENVPGVAGIGLAVQLSYCDFNEKIECLYELKQYFIEEIGKIEGTTINGKTDRKSAPHIISVSFDDVKSEVLLHALESKCIYVSAGSACASNKPAVSQTLKAIGVKKELLDSTVRFSFSFETTKEELTYCLEALKEILPKLRLYKRH
ncbi:cysteine desulfurase [Lachnotalea glycerini]|uniref:Cysteine desulfurase n=1 Tax=Lachnotalea glycerini TaxID=1763509 RepID=A0A318EVB4_9FIRM|nr:cysteine desulfurase family protein [Lachnotalea glycerini]PXV93480.1 cysteine desulfurase [Lachnotalea glycerini]